jgi:hypothetical protein
MTDPVAHAKSYPFPAPDHCFVYEAGAWRKLDDYGFERTGRTPVLAAGSNQSPEQLIRKYGHLREIGPIPAERGMLHDFDVVYAAHLAGYGSLPATFQRSPGTIVRVFVLWMTAAQLARMHETEGNYSYDHLTGIRVDFDSGATADEAFAYSSKVGCYSQDGQCIALAEIAAENRVFVAKRQTGALEMIRDRLEPGKPLDEFIRDHIDDDLVRDARSKALGERAIPALYQRRALLEL